MFMSDETLLHIEVVYALPDEQPIFKTMVSPLMSVEMIIRHCGILDAYPQIDLQHNKVGVYGRQVKLEMLVEDGDRIEIYRPLLADPKDIRRRRAELAKGKIRR